MIPVFGVPFINRTDRFMEMLQSIDEEIGKVVVIDNSPDGVLRDMSGPFPVHVVSMKHNLGVSASWNLIMKLTPDAPWWFISNSDVVFAPGELGKVAQEMEGFDGVATLIGLSAFGVSRQAIKKAGWFDENFVPAYCEDVDWDRRCQLTGVSKKDLEADSKSVHAGSSVIGSDPHYNNQNNRTYPANVLYYRAKWGGGIQTVESFSTPFNKGGDPSEWQLDIDRLAALMWR